MSDLLTDDTLSTASVVIPTHGRRDSLLRVLRALARQTVPPGTFEVLVIVDGDIDGSAPACRMLAPEVPFEIRVIENANQGPAAARNRGVMEAAAPLIVFLDDDVVPDEKLIAAHLRAQAHQDRLVAIGPLLPPPDISLNLWARYEEDRLCRQYNAMVAGQWKASYRQFYTGNASVLKRYLMSVGNFNPAFRRAEDIELGFRLQKHGLRFTFVPDARGWHYISRTYVSWLRIPAAYGTADVAMARVHDRQVLEQVLSEYSERHIAVRTLVQLCAGRPLSYRIALAVLGMLARGINKIRSVPGGTHVCGLIFNLSYYDAIAQALGGRAALQNALRGGQISVHL